LRYVEQIDIKPSERRTAHITGISSFLDKLKEYKNIDFPKEEPIETPQLKAQRLKKEKQLLNKQKLDQDFSKWNPLEDPHIKGDPYKTLFIGRLSYEVTEIDLQKEFSKYGAIERVRVVRDKESGKSKGYAFILFEKDEGARAAYKEANGLKIKGRTIITDIERSRTIKSWVPRRLGGGLGGRRHIPKREAISKEIPKKRFDSGPIGSRGRGGGLGGSRFGSRGGYGGRGGRGGGYDRSSRYEPRGGGGGAGMRSSYSTYDSRASYSSRSERPSGPSKLSERTFDRYERSDRYERPERTERSERSDRYERPERPERPERSDRYEYNSRSRRSDRDFNDRERDLERDSKISNEREKERERFRERKLEQSSKDRLRY